jgi:hypothetical protein
MKPCIRLIGIFVLVIGHAAQLRAETFTVTINGVVEYNQVTSGPLGNVDANDDASITFRVDSNIFVNSPNFPTRGYVINEESFELTLGDVTLGLQDPFPAGQTPYFVIRNNDPAVDGFFIATGLELDVGVPISQNGAFGQFVSRFMVTYGDDPLPSLDIGSATGSYDFSGLTVFNFTVDDGPFNPVGMIFEDMTIAALSDVNCGDGVCEVGETCIEDCACDTATDCCDVDGNGIRDDSCVWCECLDGQCHFIETTSPSDVAGAFGECQPEGFPNLHDAFEVLRCFASTTTCDLINLDTGGSFGDCTPDGHCNIHDYVIALIQFGPLCHCDSPAPEHPPTIAGSARLTLHSRHKAVRPGQRIAVDMYASATVPIMAYQLDAVVSGGRGGHLILEDFVVEARADDTMSDGATVATNLERGAVLRMATDAQSTSGYLGTLHYRVPRSAAGNFTIDLDISAEHDATVLIAEPYDMIEIEAVEPAVFTVRSARR